MEMIIIEKQALDELTNRLDTLKIKLGCLYENSGVAPQKWFDVQQVCTRLKISKRTLQNLRDSGVLPSTKMGGKVFYKPEDIEKMLLLNYKKE